MATPICFKLLMLLMRCAFCFDLARLGRSMLDMIARMATMTRTETTPDQPRLTAPATRTIIKAVTRLKATSPPPYSLKREP